MYIYLFFCCRYILKMTMYGTVFRNSFIYTPVMGFVTPGSAGIKMQARMFVGGECAEPADPCRCQRRSLLCRLPCRGGFMLMLFSILLFIRVIGLSVYLCIYPSVAVCPPVYLSAYITSCSFSWSKHAWTVKYSLFVVRGWRDVHSLLFVLLYFVQYSFGSIFTL